MCPGANGAKDPRGNHRLPGTAEPGGSPGEAGGLAHRCLAAVTAQMPADRQDWGRAMVAELDQLRPGGTRWRFVLGAARVALLPPGGSRPGWCALLAAAGGAVAAGVTTHVFAPAAGPAAAVSLSALAALAALGLAVARARAGRWDHVPAAHFAVVAGCGAYLALILATVQRYPAERGSDASYWASLLFIDAVVAGYLMLARWLPQRLRPVRRNHLYVLAAGVALAIPVVNYIQHPSLNGLNAGPLPGGWAWLVAFLAPLGAAFLAGGSRGRPQDGLEAATWASLLSGLMISIMIMAATYRVLPSAGGSPQLVAEAHHHGVASAAIWLASDNIGGATILLVWLPVLVFCLANLGITLGCSWAPPGSRGQGATGPLPPHRPERSRPGPQASRAPSRPAPHPGT